MDLHQYYPINVSLSIIILSMVHYHPIDEVASSYRWINITLPMNYHHPINEASLSYQWSIIIIILSMKHRYPTNGASLSSFYQ
ncbi:hypothetical protein KY285_023394 [Solanum tuberosum]|nr:hypothetical protein KY289_023727 [Solanum tuberosum]KAH0675593.1 hypothetical protein KY285_023394 [Solanum tuberosum]